MDRVKHLHLVEHGVGRVCLDMSSYKNVNAFIDFSHSTAYTVMLFFVNFHFFRSSCKPCRNRVLPVIHRAYIVQKVVFYRVHRVILPVHCLLYKK